MAYGMCMAQCKAKMPENCCEDDECEMNYCCDMKDSGEMETACMKESQMCMQYHDEKDEIPFVNCISKMSMRNRNQGCLSEMMGNVGEMCMGEVVGCLQK